MILESVSPSGDCQAVRKAGLFQLEMYLTMFIFAVIFPFECEHLVDNAVHREAGQVNKSHKELCRSGGGF